jgi:hypothetical protein
MSIGKRVRKSGLVAVAIASVLGVAGVGRASSHLIVTAGISASTIHVGVDTQTFSATVLDSATSLPVEGASVVWHHMNDGPGPCCSDHGPELTDASGTASTTVGYTSGTQDYGIYSVAAEATFAGDSVTSTALTFSVGPGDPATIGGVTLSTTNPASGASVNVTVTDIRDSDGHPAKFDTAVTVTVTAPDSTVTAIGATESGGENAGDPLNATATIPGSVNSGGGTYTVDVTTSPGTASASTSYLVPITLTLANPATIALGQFANVNVSGIPAGANSLSIQVTRPNSSTFTKAPLTYTAGGATGTFRLDPGELTLVGTYQLLVTAKNGATTLGVGTGSLQVLGTTMTLMITPSSVSPQGVVTLKATIKTVQATPVGVPGLSVSFTVRWLGALTTATATALTNSDGDAIVTISGLATLLPGSYVVSASSPPHAASGTFSVTL